MTVLWAIKAAGLTTVRTALATAVEAGWDDLTVCAGIAKADRHPGPRC